MEEPHIEDQQPPQDNETEQETESVFSSIAGHAKDFAQTKIAYYKLIAAESGGKAAAGAATGILLALFGFFFLVFISITGALAIGYALNSLVYGFLIISGIYLLLIGLTYMLKNKFIEVPITNAIIKAMANKKEDNTNGSKTDNPDK
jgi:hypothetical protein